MTKYYLLKDDGSREFTIYPHHIILDGVWCEEHNEIVELTEDNYGIILDALYEQAWDTGQTNNYAKSLTSVAKKFEKVFGGK